MKHKIITWAILYFGTTIAVFATGQIPDLLVVGKDTLMMFANPLEQYFEKSKNRELPEFEGCPSTACWRGYQAIWQFENNQIYLLEIRSCHNDCGLEVRSANLKKMFADNYTNNRVFAYWITGNLVMPFGKLLCYVHMGYASTYEKEKLFVVKNGMVKKHQDFQNIVFDNNLLGRNNCDSIFIKAIEYVNKNINWRNLPKNEKGDWEEFIEITIMKNGTTKFKVIKEIDLEYGKELNRIGKNMRWEIVKRLGKPIEEKFTVRWIFDFDNKEVR